MPTAAMSSSPFGKAKQVQREERGRLDAIVSEDVVLVFSTGVLIAVGLRGSRSGGIG